MSSTKPIGVWREGRVASADPIDPGLLVGLGVFETMLVENGRVAGSHHHIARLQRGAQTLGLPRPDEHHAYQAIEALVKLGERHRFARLRLTWTPGAKATGELLATLGSYQPVDHVALWVSPYVRNERSPLVGVKATAYAENILALSHARDHGADEAVFGNSQNQLCEGATSNIFIEHQGQLLTPPLASGCLPGITRQLCLEWGRAQGLDIRVQPIPLSVMNDTAHVALTSALKGVLPAISIDERPLKPGPLTQKLAKIYATQRQKLLRSSNELRPPAQ